MRTIRIGSRESRLAVIQSETVLDYLRDRAPEVSPELVTMKTTGDKILDRSLEAIGGKDLFVRELDRALREGRSDLSVHSLKDVPMEVPEDLPLLGFSRREDPRDALVLPAGATVWDRSLPVGCSSRRRMVQLQRLVPDVTFAPVRGNVQTRLKKLDAGEYGALILAAAGLRRLGLAGRISHLFSADRMIPAAGQGILAVQGRAGEDYSFLKGYFCEEARVCALAERAFVRRLDGGCSSPIAAHAWVQGDALTLRGLYYSEEKQDFVTGILTGRCCEGEYLGAELAERLRRQLDG
ncbi:MAG: hydroxymethylbilane synthase [Lachnospiraceae bacterium]|nr:hydroxymethylbilane synthase [Lachnospiraceae bacterium]